MLHDQGPLPQGAGHRGDLPLPARRGLDADEASDGSAARERFLPGRMVYVPPFWGHRTVNTGDEPLISFCVCPGEAGHNYGDIEKEGFPERVFKRAGKVEFVSSKAG